MQRGVDETARDNSTVFTDFYKQTCNAQNVCDNEERTDFPRFQNLNIDDFAYYTTDKFNESIKIEIGTDFTTLHINVRGIECNYDNLIMYLNMFKIPFDVIVLSECHINGTTGCSDIDKKFDINGYQKFYCKSRIKFGGVVVYVKNTFDTLIVNELTIAAEYYDSLYLKIRSPNGLKPVILGAYYRHCRHNSHDIIKFANVLDEHLSHKSVTKHNKVIAGDFNICLLKSVSNMESLTYLNTLFQNGLETHIFLPTRITYMKDSMQVKSLSLIDHIHSNLYANECISGNLSYPDSDHYGNFAVFKGLFQKISAKPVQYRRDFKNCDHNKLIDDFNGMNWDDLVIGEDNLETASDNLTNTLENLYDKHVPLVKLSNRKSKYCDKPWIRGQLLLDIRTKNNLHGIKGSSANNEENFRVNRNHVTSQLRRAKKMYFKDYFNNHRNNTRKMWEGINLALAQSKNKKQLPSQIKDENGNTLNDPQDIANSFAKYFENVPLKTRSKIKPGNRHYLDYLHKMKPVDNYLVLHDSSPDEVLKLINGLNDYSSPGPLPIPNKFLKILAQPLSNILCTIVNRSMSIGYVPTCFKIGKQTPVFKSGEIQVQNFRPITVCNSLSKILEKTVRARVTSFLYDLNILNNRQFGFRKNHSTAHAIMNLFETSLEGLDKKLKVGGVYLDISKAFDCVSHDILLRKLEYYGFRDRSLMWFQSYLKDRTQYVEVKGKRSNKYKTLLGVPQGGVLAPILFILFINDVITSSSVLEFSIYADDTCLILAINRNLYDETMVRELSKVFDWFSCNELLLNIKKTDYQNFGPHFTKQYIRGEVDLAELHEVGPQFLFEGQPWENNGPSHHEINKKGEFVLYDLYQVMPEYMIQEVLYTDDGTEILESTDVKYLGLNIDNKFEFCNHINIQYCKLNRMVNTYWKCPDIGLSTKKIIYHSLVESHLNYGLLVWGSNFCKKVCNDVSANYTPANIKPIKKAQNKIIRAIFRKPKFNKYTRTNTDMSPLYKELGVLKLYDLYRYQLALLCFDFHHNPDFPDRISSFFTLKSDISTRNTRQHHLTLYPAQVNLANTSRKPSYVASFIWNSLPDYIKDISSKNKFKTAIKSYIIGTY